LNYTQRNTTAMNHLTGIQLMDFQTLIFGIETSNRSFKSLRKTDQSATHRCGRVKEYVESLIE